jgi:hypothetical protein
MSFGFGLMLLTFVQRLPDATQAGLDKFLFGQAAALLERDVTRICAYFRRQGLDCAPEPIVARLWEEYAEPLPPPELELLAAGKLTPLT